MKVTDERPLTPMETASGAELDEWARWMREPCRGSRETDAAMRARLICPWPSGFIRALYGERSLQGAMDVCARFDVDPHEVAIDFNDETVWRR